MKIEICHETVPESCPSESKNDHQPTQISIQFGTLNTPYVLKKYESSMVKNIPNHRDLRQNICRSYNTPHCAERWRTQRTRQGINPSPKLVIKSPTCWSITALINSSPKCWWWLRNACITEMANNAAEIKQFCHRNIIFVTELIKLSPKGPNPSPKFNPVSPVAFKSEIRYNLWYIVYFECIFKQSLR